jgi:hypothetical protein
MSMHRSVAENRRPGITDSPAGAPLMMPVVREGGGGAARGFGDGLRLESGDPQMASGTPTGP